MNVSHFQLAGKKAGRIQGFAQNTTAHYGQHAAQLYHFLPSTLNYIDKKYFLNS